LAMFVTAKRRKSGPKTRAACNNNIDKKMLQKKDVLLSIHTPKFYIPICTGSTVLHFCKCVPVNSKPKALR